MTKAFADNKGESNKDLVQSIADQIEAKLEGLETSVEEVQDLCEDFLMKSEHRDVAKRYILYRNERSKIRKFNPGATEKFKYLSADFLRKYKHRPDPFPTEMGKFVYYRTYSRPVPEENRREFWWETVARVVEFNSTLEEMALKKQGFAVEEQEIERLKRTAEKIYDLMYELKLFPSGRSLWVGGTPSSYLYPLSNFNCSFVTIDEFDKFSEIFFVLMLGTGVGLSVERKYIEQLPRINTGIELISKSFEAVPVADRREHTQLIYNNNSAVEIVIGDSKSGWAEAIGHYFDIITSKQFSDVKYIFVNYNNVRPAGERLKTFGGYASGHTAIKKMFEKMNKLFKDRADGELWYKARPLDALDLATIIAENVVSGGTRRSAEIIFCDPDETEVLEAKANIYNNVDGEWVANQDILHRFLSNNTEIGRAHV